MSLIKMSQDAIFRLFIENLINGTVDQSQQSLGALVVTPAVCGVGVGAIRVRTNIFVGSGC